MALAQTQPYPGKSADLISLGDGLNYSTPLSYVGGTLVPNALFFLRSNNPPPDLQPSDWRLRIDGRVRTPITLKLAVNLVTLLATLNCLCAIRADSDNSVRYALFPLIFGIRKGQP